MSSRPSAAALALAAVMIASPAAAQDPADVAAARDLFIEGSELARQAQWAEARDRYERSLQLKRAAITLYSLGVAQKHAGALVAALESFRAFLIEPSAPATRAYEAPAREAVAELEQRVARLEIKISPAGVAALEVRLDGALIPAAALDRPRLVDPGQHELTATAPGYVPLRRTTSPAEGGRAIVVLHLERDGSAPPEAKPAPVRPIAADPPGQAGAGAGAEGDAPSRALPITLIAGGAALLGAGVAVGLLGVSKGSDAPTRDGVEADSARTQALVGDVVAGAGLAMAGVGLIVLLAQGSPAPAGKPAASAWIAPGGAGLRLRF